MPTVPRLFCNPLPDSFTSGSWVGFSSQLALALQSAAEKPPPWITNPHDAMEEGVRVEALVDVTQEVGDGQRRAVGLQLDDELAHVSGDAHGLGFGPGCECRQEYHGKRDSDAQDSRSLTRSGVWVHRLSALGWRSSH